MGSKHKSELFKSGFVQLECETGHLIPVVRNLKASTESGRYGSDLSQAFQLDPETQPETVLGVSDDRISELFTGILSGLELGRFTSSHIILHRYRKTKAMNWHHDVFDRSIVLALAYLSEDTFSESDGGILEIGRCHVDEAGIPTGPPKVVHRVLPNKNTIVLLNNTDPTLMHRVTPMLSDMTRIVLSCQLGYAEMVFR